ncbi:MAG: type II toxin-antitoxin system RelE/ParE family toxin [Chloroflexi bacterium]|nr:type II toxin-antitoxin system RelE/ParE family toxin [Chloroflexota bacterium]
MKHTQVILTPEAQSDLRSIASATRTRLLDKLEWIGENVELIQHQAMQGDEWKGCYKYRVGDYRIIYQMEHPATKLIVKLIVLKVGHRREVYK